MEFKANAGDRVKVLTSEETIEGILMPHERSFVVVKLDNGYNIGIDRRKIKSIELVKKHSPQKSKPAVKQDSKLPTISILHTGGTIASRVDYSTGGVVAKFTPEELISMFPELTSIANIKSKVIGQIMSEDMRFSHYNIVARAIDKEVQKGVDGIIITHGTDTMHYTSAALSFMLQNLPVPVILVGAQRSSDRGSSDAAINLLSAALFISNSEFSEVAVCMHESMSDESCLILPGTKCRKMHTSRRDAFRPINAAAIASVNPREKRISFFRKGYAKKDKKRKLELKLIDENIKVGLLKSHPNMFSNEIEAFRGYDGLVVEGTGLGHLPNATFDEATKEHEKIMNGLKELINSGTVVVMAPQTIYGRIQMDVYSAGRILQGIGVVGNFSDMTPETTFVKLAWLLSNYPKEEVKKLITTNICGELTERTEPDTFLI